MLRFSPADGEQELTAERTLNSKVFSHHPTKRRIQSSIARVHYDRNGELVDLDRDIVANGNSFSTIDTPYILNFMADQGRVEYQSKNGGFRAMQLAKVGGSAPPGFSNIRQTDRYKIELDVNPSLSLQLILYPTGVEMFKIIKDPGGLEDLEWEIDTDELGQIYIPSKTFGMDNLNNDPAIRGVDRRGVNRRRFIEINTTIGNLKNIPGGKKRYTHTERVTGRTRFKKGDGAREFRNEIAYPILVDTLIAETIEANLDDGNVESGTFYGISYNHVPFMDLYGANSTCPIFRFATVALPAGGTVDNATLTLECTLEYGNGSDANLEIIAEDTDDATGWTQASSHTSPFAWTTEGTSATSTFNSPTADGEGTGTYNIAVDGIVQEIHARAGWSTGQGMRFAFTDDPNLSGQLNWGHLDAGSGTEADLEINHSTGGGIPILARQHYQRIMGY